VALVTGVLPDTERIVERLRLLTQPLREGAPTWLRNRLLIYESRGATQFGAIISLSNCALGDAVRKLVKRFDLTDSEGHPLKVNVSRMRKTFSGRIWEITKGDIAVTAAAAGHDPRIAGSHYLAPPVEAKKNWRFMGELLATNLATNFESTKVGTPAGKCADIRNGQFAPKNGEPCDRFMNCVRCREYVVTGDDLWRVFSFYWLVVRERDRVGKKRWARNYSHIVRIIDRDIAEAGIRQRKFSRSAVTAARERAKTHPHPYWADRAQFGELI
jgi:hypothetical protein